MFFKYGVPLKDMPGIASYTAQFPTIWCDKYGQWQCGGSITNTTNDILGMARASIKYGRMIQAPEKPVFSPPGTITGIKTMFRAPAVLQSLLPLGVPDIWQKLFADITCSVNKYQMESGGFGVIYAMAYITGVGQVEWESRIDPITGEFSATSVKAPFPEQFVAYNMKIAHPKYEPNMFIGLYVFASKDPDAVYTTPVIVPDAPYLYHVTKINAEITPPHYTQLRAGQMVRITAKAKEGFTLTNFIIDGVEYLPGAMKTYEDINAPGITPPEGYDPNEAVVMYGPVKGDVYVSAIALGVTIDKHITAGDTTTFQMTTTDCLVEEDSWSLGETNLPGTAIRSISPTGLVSILFPEDVYDGNPGGTYYLEVKFRGYSQTKTLRLIFTVDPVPAFGTVWTPVTKLSESVTAMVQGTDGYTYITGVTKMWRTNDLLSFEPITVASAPSGSFADVGECSMGIVASDRYSLWLMPTGTTTLTKIAATTVVNYFSSTAISASPDSPLVSLQATNSLGRYYIMNMWNVQTGVKATGPHTLSATGNIAYSRAVRPVKAKDGSWIFVGAMSGSYGLGRYANGTFTLLEANTANSAGSVMSVFLDHSTGILYLVGHKLTSPNRGFFRTSTDHGATWSADTIFTNAANAGFTDTLCLKKGYSILAQGAWILRSTDSLGSMPIVFTTNGDISSFLMIGGRKLLAGTNGGTTNLYKSEA